MSARTLKAASFFRVRTIRRTAVIAVLALTSSLVTRRDVLARAEGPSRSWRIAGGKPLRVWIQPAASAAGASRIQAVRRAVADWNAQRLPVRMRPGADSLAAEVRVFWTDRFDEPISGRTTCVDDGARRIVSAEVVLARRHSDGRVLSDEEVRVIALHELGHAIGLDHSTDSTSVMWPRVRVRGISAADRARVLALYSTR